MSKIWKILVMSTAVGTVDKCRERCQQYTHALLFSSVAEVPDYSNMDALLATKREHEEITAKIEAFLKQVPGDAIHCPRFLFHL